MTDRIELSINGLPVTAEKDMTILEAALGKGIYIPHLCHHHELKPVGVCRLCLVEIDGKKTAIACKTPVQDGMVIRTESPEINKIRRVTVELLIADHDTDCLNCAMMERLRPREQKLPVDDSNPFFDFNPNRCVLCGICVRTCSEIQGVDAIDFIHRGVETKIASFRDKPRVESNCESCGECVVRCPVGALTEKDTQRPTHQVKTVCPFCGCGCGLLLGVRDNRIVSSKGDLRSPVNKGRLCVKGRFGYKFINHPDRLTVPLIKKNGKFAEATWEDALDLIANKLANYKGDQFATIASARCTNEENYLIQKFTRVVMGTNNIDHCARL
jgi:formate dehydrogenase major subunit